MSQFQSYEQFGKIFIILNQAVIQKIFKPRKSSETVFLF